MDEPPDVTLPSGSRGDAADEAGDDAGSPGLSLVLNLGGLVLVGAVLLALLLRAPDSPAPFSRGDGGTPPHRDLPESRSIPTGDSGSANARPDALIPARNGGRGGRSGPPPLMLRQGARVPEREPLAGLPGAVERFGEAFAIRHPAYLPADVAPFTVQWQPAADPERRSLGHGELLTWFYSAEHGSVLVLAQGPGAGIWPLTAGDDRAGRLRLADGTEVIWVVGHPVRVASDPPGELEWAGTEVTLGVPPSSGEGWYLSSPIISLTELVRIAESLREVREIGE